MQATLATRSDFYRAIDRECYGYCSYTTAQIEDMAIDYLREEIKKHEAKCKLTGVVMTCECVPMRNELGRLEIKKAIANFLA